MRARRLPNGNLLLAVELTEPAEGLAMPEIGPDDPNYSGWLHVSD